MFLLFMIFIREKQFHNMTPSDFGFGQPNLKGTICACWQKSLSQSSCVLGEFAKFHGRPSVQKFSAFSSTFSSVVLFRISLKMLFHYFISVSSRGKKFESSFKWFTLS